MELRLPRFSSGDLSTAGAVSVGVVTVALGLDSSELCLGLPELARRLSNAPNTPFRPVFGEDGDPTGGGLLPSDIPPCESCRVRSANSVPMGASSGFEDLSDPRVRPMPALEEDMRR
jgi:hypothetical protein